MNVSVSVPGEDMENVHNEVVSPQFVLFGEFANSNSKSSLIVSDRVYNEADLRVSPLLYEAKLTGVTQFGAIQYSFPPPRCWTHANIQPSARESTVFRVYLLKNGRLIAQQDSPGFLSLPKVDQKKHGSPQMTTPQSTDRSVKVEPSPVDLLEQRSTFLSQTQPLEAEADVIPLIDPTLEPSEEAPRDHAVDDTWKDIFCDIFLDPLPTQDEIEGVQDLPTIASQIQERSEGKDKKRLKVA